jgi:hypothetical protein
MISLLAAVLIVTAEGQSPKGKEPTSAAMKDTLKGAIAVDSTSDGDAGTPRAGPDVSKMPFTPESVKTVVAFYQPQIQNCYEETLASKDKDVQGTLKTSWVVGSEGYVKKVKIDKKGSSLKDPRLHDCVVAVLSSMQFPKPPGGKDQPINFPFNLKAVH